jgi:hypothetical protein
VTFGPSILYGITMKGSDETLRVLHSHLTRGNSSDR